MGASGKALVASMAAWMLLKSPFPSAATTKVVLLSSACRGSDTRPVKNKSITTSKLFITLYFKYLSNANFKNSQVSTPLISKSTRQNTPTNPELKDKTSRQNH